MRHVTYPLMLLLMLMFSMPSVAQGSDGASKRKHAAATDPAAEDFSKDYIMGKFDPSNHPGFTLIPGQFRDEKIMYLRKDVLRAFINMYQAAQKEGIKLEIKSATRNFEAQKKIWENKWTGATLLRGNVNAARDIADPVQRALTILEYSSMPGTSRHH